MKVYCYVFILFNLLFKFNVEVEQVFEKIVSKYIIEFMEENELFYKNLFGFRKHHSTSHAIITLVEKVSNALDKGKLVSEYS